ncbi:unnamed protein product [Paramecium sonneborni]|uniref:Uncharacterized protein n=1 Tax=Paramecium sonneborni TaxID=65129 RepID=A0A8S1QUX7_9CILI|nr:unnamed protein product [Paramecium sonneborni]
MIEFYKFTLYEILTKQDSLKVFNLNKLRTTQRKSKLNRLIINLSLKYLRLNLFKTEEATYYILKKPNYLGSIKAFQQLKNYKYFNQNHHYNLQYMIYEINNKFKLHKTVNKCIQNISFIIHQKIDQYNEIMIPNQYLKIIKNKINKIISSLQFRTLIVILYINKIITNKEMIQIFNCFRSLQKQVQVQFFEVQDGIAKMLVKKLKPKIQKLKSQKFIQDLNKSYEKISCIKEIYQSKLQKKKANYSIRLLGVNNDRYKIIRELMITMNEIKKTLSKDESNSFTFQKTIENKFKFKDLIFRIIKFLKKRNQISFEYFNQKKKYDLFNCDIKYKLKVKKQFQLNEQQMINEIQQLEQELQININILLWGHIGNLITN